MTTAIQAAEQKAQAKVEQIKALQIAAEAKAVADNDYQKAYRSATDGWNTAELKEFGFDTQGPVRKKAPRKTKAEPEAQPPTPTEPHHDDVQPYEHHN